MGIFQKFFGQKQSDESAAADAAENNVFADNSSKHAETAEVVSEESEKQQATAQPDTDVTKAEEVPAESAAQTDAFAEKAEDAAVPVTAETPEAVGESAKPAAQTDASSKKAEAASTVEAPAPVADTPTEPAAQNDAPAEKSDDVSATVTPETPEAVETPAEPTKTGFFANLLKKWNVSSKAPVELPAPDMQPQKNNASSEKAETASTVEASVPVTDTPTEPAAQNDAPAEKPDDVSATVTPETPETVGTPAEPTKTGFFANLLKKWNVSSKAPVELPAPDMQPQKNDVSSEKTEAASTVEAPAPVADTPTEPATQNDAPAEKSDDVSATVTPETPEAVGKSAEPVVQNNAPAEKPDDVSAGVTPETPETVGESAEPVAQNDAPAEKTEDIPSVTTAPAAADIPQTQTVPKDTQATEIQAAAKKPNPLIPLYHRIKAWADAPVRDFDRDAHPVIAFLVDAADLFETAFISLFVVMLFLTYILCGASVDGSSMLPTLQSGEHLLVSRLDRSFHTGDIVIIRCEKSSIYDENGVLTEGSGIGKTIVKRLIATGGQVVDIDFRTGIVSVDGTPLDEPYTSTLTHRDEGAFTYPVTVPEGYVFVLGDNRSISKDSRHPSVGFQRESDILGTVKFRVSPPTSFD